MESSFVDNKTVVELMYFQGDECTKDTNFSTSIKFFCDQKAGLGNPILQNIEDCHYLFDFPTIVMCETEPIEFHKDSCEIYSRNLDKTKDLKIFGDAGKFNVRVRI